MGTVFVILVIVAVVVMQRPGEQSAVLGEGELLVDLDSAEVQSIEIISPSHRIVFVRQGAEWSIQEPVSYRADQASVTSLIRQVAALHSKAIVSSNPEKQALFEVDSHATTLTLHRPGASPVALVLGKMGGTVAETYVRHAESEDVHLVDAALTFVGSRALNEWRDRTIVKVPREEIREIVFQYGDTTFAVTFQDSLWLVGDVPADDALITSLVSSLAEVRADDFIDTLFSPPPSVEAVVAFAGREIRFSVGRTGDTYLVETSGLNQWFEMRSWRAQQILKRKKDLVTTTD
jgi:hypothetical protein